MRTCWTAAGEERDKDLRIRGEEMCGVGRETSRTRRMVGERGCVGSRSHLRPVVEVRERAEEAEGGAGCVMADAGSPDGGGRDGGGGGGAPVEEWGRAEAGNDRTSERDAVDDLSWERRPTKESVQRSLQY